MNDEIRALVLDAAYETAGVVSNQVIDEMFDRLDHDGWLSERLLEAVASLLCRGLAPDCAVGLATHQIGESIGYRVREHLAATN